MSQLDCRAIDVPGLRPAVRKLIDLGYDRKDQSWNIIALADGHAWAFVRYSRDDVEEEREASAVRAGIHGHRCQPAWQWRAERR